MEVKWELQTIKKNFEDGTLPGFSATRFLIEQAEKSREYEKTLNEIADEGHSYLGEVAKFCINKARQVLGKEKLQ